ncbi:hypothetical protein [Streptacidiphilus cavernicola]|uniref:Uncharacterized protein n=1 Tax=Streptacidiphilus cavernicola TaxID=3342716 RepID=A0ABV6VNF7_9ACTN
MNQQVKRWARAITAMVAGLVAVNAPVFYLWGTTQNGGLAGPTPLGGLLRDWGAQALVILLIYLVADQISRRLLRDRYSLAIGAVLFLAVGGTYEWVAFGGPGVEFGGFAYGWSALADTLALPFALGAWMLWLRTPKPAPDPFAAEVTGAWESADGVLECGSDGVFTLTRAGASTIAGLWESLPGERPQIVLKVVAPTDLGHGWQATVLDLEVSPHGAVLRGAADYRRREAEAALEQSTGYIGAVEIIEG